ncbi:MAG: response regulator transcription factor [Chloroflexota bacterium]|nr:response regulator transcription factor [Chloroflexota bacterium]
MHEILVVDDDAQMLDMVELVLRREGFNVHRAFSAQDALAQIDRETPDLLLIDAILPDVDGIQLCRKLRAQSETANTPIIFLTGYDAPFNVVDALGAGGDDFIRKPFVPRELAARVRAHIRRSAYYSDVQMPVVRVLPDSYQVFVNDREVTLTRVEFDLLTYLCRAPHKLHATEDLLMHVWKYPNGVGDAALVRNHVHNLRQKLEVDPDRPSIIQSRHGRGYVIKAHIQLEQNTA